MPCALLTARQIFGGGFSCIRLQSTVTTCSHGAKSVTPSQKFSALTKYQHVALVAGYTHTSLTKVPVPTETKKRPSSSSSLSSAPTPWPSLPLIKNPGIVKRHTYASLVGPNEVSLNTSSSRDLGDWRCKRSYLTSSAHVPGGSIRAFGGQSVVPWELALFLVDEMKGEGVEPGAVVYTAALAECRWARQDKHATHLLQQMDVEGISVVSGIPGATDNDLPPSQAPPLFGKLPEKPPNSAESSSSLEPGSSDVISPATAAAIKAAKTADRALATVEVMWAGEKHDPSPSTCRAALDACAAGGQWERALSLVRDSAMAIASDTHDSACEAPGGSEEKNVSARVEKLALEGKWDEAFLLIHSEMGSGGAGASGG